MLADLHMKTHMFERCPGYRSNNAYLILAGLQDKYMLVDLQVNQCMLNIG